MFFPCTEGVRLVRILVIIFGVTWIFERNRQNLYSVKLLYYCSNEVGQEEDRCPLDCASNMVTNVTNKYSDRFHKNTLAHYRSRYTIPLLHSMWAATLPSCFSAVGSLAILSIDRGPRKPSGSTYLNTPLPSRGCSIALATTVLVVPPPAPSPATRAAAV